ncbi:hypothetical protein PR048_010491 [Dryococelus australis]|uniref:Uncharacterized protein n=1 Tax=Dryococelus australis TaxID=614101 RepID=A0ABQ9I2X9_9NEOP|nr:hypothetical protein PR048_010491 [Dryococelus australis]
MVQRQTYATGLVEQLAGSAGNNSCGTSLRAFQSCSVPTSLHTHRLSRPRCYEPPECLHSFNHTLLTLTLRLLDDPRKDRDSHGFRKHESPISTTARTPVLLVSVLELTIVLLVHTTPDTTLYFAAFIIGRKLLHSLILLASHQGKLGSIPGRVTPGFSHVGIVRTMALVGRLSRGIPFPPPFSIRRCSILTSVTLIDSQDLAGYDNFASSMTCRLDSSVFYILEPQMCVHWLLPHTWQLWDSQGGTPGIRRGSTKEDALGVSSLQACQRERAILLCWRPRSSKNTHTQTPGGGNVSFENILPEDMQERGARVLR